MRASPGFMSGDFFRIKGQFSSSIVGVVARILVRFGPNPKHYTRFHVRAVLIPLLCNVKMMNVGCLMVKGRSRVNYQASATSSLQTETPVYHKASPQCLAIVNLSISNYDTTSFDATRDTRRQMMSLLQTHRFVSRPRGSTAEMQMLCERSISWPWYKRALHPDFSMHKEFITQ